MPRPPRESDTPGEMCSYNPRTGKYGDRWLCEELLGEDLSGPPLPRATNLSSTIPMTPTSPTLNISRTNRNS